MLTKDEARALVEKVVSKSAPKDEEWVILEHCTIEKPWGWVFFYNSREYVTTGDPIFQLYGNAPYIVNKETGELVSTGTAEGIDDYIARYEATLSHD